MKPTGGSDRLLWVNGVQHRQEELRIVFQLQRTVVDAVAEERVEADGVVGQHLNSMPNTAFTLPFTFLLT